MEKSNENMHFLSGLKGLKEETQSTIHVHYFRTDTDFLRTVTP